MGIAERTLSTTLDLETDLSEFNYQGFLLDRAVVTELSAGLGVVSPSEWPLRVRAGVIGYYTLADFGNSQGVRLYGVLLIPRFR